MGIKLSRRGGQDTSLTKKYELCPEKYDTKKWEIQGNTVKERADNAWSADRFRSRIVCELRTGFDKIRVIFAIRLFSRISRRSIAECLWPKGCILRSNDHGDGIIECQGDQGEHRGRHEQSLWRRMTLADLEDPNPEKTNTSRCDPHDRATEEQQDEQRKESVVKWENLRSADEDPVDRVEDVDITKNVPAILLAY